jgi:hypothetical protein
MFCRRCTLDSVVDPGALVPRVSLEVVDVFYEKPNGTTSGLQFVAAARAF